MKRTSRVVVGLVAALAMVLAFGSGAGADHHEIVPGSGFDGFDIENYADTVNENGVDVDSDKSDASPDVMFDGPEPASVSGTGGSGGVVALAHTGFEDTVALAGLALLAVGAAVVTKSRRLSA